MAYFARVEDHTVIAVHVVADDIDDGAAFLAHLHGGRPEAWIQTYTDGTRGQQASPGDLWDGTNFAPPETALAP